MSHECVVIDTNVFISFALSPTTTLAQSVEWAFLSFVILHSPATLSELITQLLQPKFDRYATSNNAASCY